VLANPTGWARDKSLGKNQKGSRRAAWIHKSCPTCNAQFETLASQPKTFCSNQCVKRGGAREGSGRAKTGWYQGIYCGSTYELSFLIWHLDNGISIKRCTQKFVYTFNNESHTYYPDFEVNGTIFEIKGRIQDVDHVKVRAANAILVDKEQMKKYIVYVSEKYGIAKDKLYTLYN